MKIVGGADVYPDHIEVELFGFTAGKDESARAHEAPKPVREYSLFELIARWWCRIAHHKISRAVHGEYRCWTCLRTYPAWGEETHA